MGIAGPLPNRQIRTHALEALSPPDWLEGQEQGLNYWYTHCQSLADNQLLTRETRESFALHCSLFQRLYDMKDEPTCRSYLDLHKAFVTSCKFFRTIPNGNEKVKESRFEDYTEIDV